MIACVNGSAWIVIPLSLWYVCCHPDGFYYPGKGKSGDLPPRKGFAEKWHPPILANLPNIELTILIGQYAQKYYLPENDLNVTETVHHFRDFLLTFSRSFTPHHATKFGSRKIHGLNKRSCQHYKKQVKAILSR